MTKMVKKIWSYVLIAFIVFLMLFTGSALSPIHDISYLSYDSSVFYVIGRGIKYGKIPYIDLTDHKGIYIFLVYFLGALIAEFNHIGIFIVALLLAILSSVFIYKISFLLTKNVFTSILTSIFMIMLQYSYFFSHGGMQCETMLMPYIYKFIYFLKVYNE